MVRTKTLVKNAIIVIDATPFRQWYESHYVLPLGRKRETKKELAEDDVLNKKRCRKVMAKYLARQKLAKVEPAIEEQFVSGRILGEFIYCLLFFCRNISSYVRKLPIEVDAKDFINILK